MGFESNPLNTFEHVVVLMLENRSFDNLLGYLYPDGVPADAPLAKTFEGVAGRDLSNPDDGGTPIPVSVGTDHHQPFPDPGEEFDHVQTQIFGRGRSSPEPMKGFVVDYVAALEDLTKLHGLKRWRGSPAVQSKTIMNCFDPNGLPVLSRLAEEFAVFDHWFCAVPSQTWCNRAFWHAATSWGWVNNPPIGHHSDPWNHAHWQASSAGETLFDQIEAKFGKGSWHIYADLPIPFTTLVHWGDLKYKLGREHVRSFHDFLADCHSGCLPNYSFVEPHFINFVDGALWHDDMHPSSWHSALYHKTPTGSVALGDQLVLQVYKAIRDSTNSGGSYWKNTLLIITFDEHGGCFDHVVPPPTTPPDVQGFNTKTGQEGFDFKRLGVRVPTVMISAHIGKHTVVNSQMQHCSFLKTMQQKWGLDDLGPRQQCAPPFTEVFTSPEVRALNSWPEWSSYPGPVAGAEEVPEIDPSDIPLNDLQTSIVGAMRENLASEPKVAELLKVTPPANDYQLLTWLAESRHPPDEG